MSDVNAADLTPIASADDVIANYDGAGENAKLGIEVELCFFNEADSSPMSVAQNEALIKTMRETHKADWVRQEPSAETVEVNSIAQDWAGLPSVIKDTNDKMDLLVGEAAKLGLKRSFFSDLPHKTHQDLLNNIVNVERYQAFFQPPREDMMEIAAYFTVCKSNQVSVSYKTHDHLLANIRRLYALTPFLFMLTGNTSAFAENQLFTGHHGMRYRRGLYGRGGCPCYVFTAKSGEEYIDAHINHVMNNPLYVFYDENGVLKRIPSGTWTTFNTLKKEGLNTSSNFHLSESIIWPDVKIAALKDKDDHVVGHRYEGRMFGVGAHQHTTAALITGALAFHDNFGAQIDELLKRYGFDFEGAEGQTRIHLRAAYAAATEHDNHFFNIPYGTGTMAEFAKEFANLMEAALDGAGYDTELAPLLHICRTGITDTKANRLLFPNMQDIQNVQSTYDPQIFKVPHQSNAALFANKIKEVA